MILVLGLSFFLIMLIGAPIMTALGLSAAVALQAGERSLLIVVQMAFQSLDSFSLMAVPFFILAGHLMQSGGVARRLVQLANAFVGWIRGGLGAVAVLTSMLFATVSGSSSATTAAIGSVLIPEMEKKGYPRSFAASVAASSGELGAIIPPSIPMIVYALTANVSVGALFIAGILPGVLITLSLILTVYVIARIKGFDPVAVAGSDAKLEWCKSIGYRTGINHRTAGDLTEAIARACPSGVDVFMDNTAGPLHDAALLNLNTFGRIVVVGTVALADRFDQPDIGPRFLRRILVARARIEGFLLDDFAAQFAEARSQLARWYREGLLEAREDVAEGIEAAPHAFIRMLKGENFGKQLVKV